MYLAMHIYVATYMHNYMVKYHDILHNNNYYYMHSYFKEINLIITLWSFFLRCMISGYQSNGQVDI